jgi:hypothetical protein
VLERLHLAATGPHDDSVTARADRGLGGGP